MSYSDGWAAINLEMPDRVPRTEYSAEFHWDLIKTVTGIDVSTHSTKENQNKAASQFIKVWNYDFIWNILTHCQVFGDYRTKMGHAEYASGGVDYNNEISCPFEEPEDALKFDPWEAYGR